MDRKTAAYRKSSARTTRFVCSDFTSAIPIVVSTIIWGMVSVFGMTLCVACGPSEGITSSTTSYPSVASKWSSPSIAVCWEEAAMIEEYAHGRGLVEKGVKEQYEEKSALRFPGWKACEKESRGIRINVADEKDGNPHTRGLGKNLDGVTNGMELNFTFRHWSTSCQKKTDYCIRVIAIHEFGHAVGLSHEQNRTDTPDSCTDKPQGTNGDTIVGDWDQASVMNYCNPKYCNDGILSKGDIAGLEKLYGKKP